MRPKYKRVFARALEERQAEIAAIRALGWSWSSVSEHFSDDYLLGGVPGNGFSAAWSRLVADGKKPDKLAVEAAKKEILMIGGLKPGLWVLDCNPMHHETGKPTGEEADVVRRMHLAAKLARLDKDKAVD